MKCDEGYPCRVCGGDVTSIVDSDLYLRFVIGHLDPEHLHTAAECHLRCNPSLAQFISDDRFEPVLAEGDFAKTRLDPAHVAQQSSLITRGYRRLHEIAAWPDSRDVTEYPLPEAAQKYRLA